MKEASKVLESVRKEKEEAISGQQYEFAAELREREVKLQERMEDLEKAWRSGPGRRSGARRCWCAGPETAVSALRLKRGLPGATMAG